MNIQRYLKLLITSLLLVSLIFILTLPSLGYCDDWVYVGKDMMFSYYYDKESVVIDHNSSLINVWVKFIYTDEGKKLFNPIDKTLSLYTQVSHP